MRLGLEPLEDRKLLALVGIAGLLQFPVVTYDSTGTLAYDGSIDRLDLDATPLLFRQSAASPIRPVTGTVDFKIQIQVDGSGSLLGGVAGHDLVLTGDIDVDGDSIVDFSGTLLTGEVTQFGFADIGTTDSYDFRFAPTGGALAGLWAGKDIGVTTTSENSTFVGTFAETFNGGAKGNIGAIPALFSSLAGHVYHDANNNGLFETGLGEAGIAGATVTLTGTDDLGNGVNLSTLTDAAGAYSFTDLRPGTYQLAETQPAGFLDGIDTVGTPGGTTTDDVFAAILLPAGFNGANNNFGELLPAALAGFVYVDLNNDGILLGEPPIAGATVTLTGNDDLGNAVNISTTTDATGAYGFANLRPGTYEITETQPAAFLDGIDTIGTPGGTTADDVFAEILLPAGSDGVNNNFGELPPASLAGCVYLDINNNGLQNAGESGIFGVTILLTGTDDLGDAVNLSTMTDSNGHYSFGNLRPGTYRINEVHPAVFLDGIDTLGSLGGAMTNDQFTGIVLAPAAAGVDYCFGERGLEPTLISKEQLLASTPPTLARWVDSLYQTVLGRSGSLNEILGWLDAIQAGATFQQVAGAFLYSTERRSAVIDDLYQQYLGRSADADGLAHWLRVWDSASLESVQARIIASAEFYQSAGGTDADWVAALYQNLLNRSALPAEIDFWTGRLAATSRAEVVMGFVTSDEHRGGQIQAWYTSYLGRPIDAAGLAHWLVQLRHGETQETVQAKLLASLESRIRWA
ncbi:MAG: SdrD B-like domain-containing protein [Pirellulales bacterium]